MIRMTYGARAPWSCIVLLVERRTGRPAERETIMNTYEKSWTASELEYLIMTWDEGCVEGRLRFLREGLGIEVATTQSIEVSVKVNVSKWDHDGTALDEDDVASAVVSIIDSYLAGELNAEEAEGWKV